VLVSELGRFQKREKLLFVLPKEILEDRALFFQKRD